MSDKIQEGTVLEDPDKVKKTEEKTTFFTQLDNTAKQTSARVRNKAKEIRTELNEVYDNAQEFAERYAKKMELLISRVAYATVTLMIYFIHASAICYLSMSVNVNQGLGGVKMSGPPFKPPRFTMNKCPEEDFTKGFFENIRNSLKEFGFPYKNMVSCDNFAMIKEPFTYVRFSRWVSNTIAFSYSSGRKYLNAIFSFFSDPIAAFWILPILVPIILMVTLLFAPATTLFGGLLLGSEILPSNFFGMFAFYNPFIMFFTVCAFISGIIGIPILNTFAMFASALFFFMVFPYILNDKFIFPNDPTMKPYSGFEFIWRNISYRWETILLAWLLVVAKITKNTFDTKSDLQATVIATDGLNAKVIFDSGSKLTVNTSELSIDPDIYLKINTQVKVNTNPLGTNSYIGTISNITTIDGELVYDIFVQSEGKEDRTETQVKHSDLTPIVTVENEQKIRKKSRVIVNSKSTAGSIASMFIYILTLGWSIWITFRHSSSYVVLSVLLYVIEFLVDYQVILSLIVLIGVCLYYAIIYKDDVVDVANEIKDEAEKISGTKNKK